MENKTQAELDEIEYKGHLRLLEYVRSITKETKEQIMIRWRNACEQWKISNMYQKKRKKERLDAKPKLICSFNNSPLLFIISYLDDGLPFISMNYTNEKYELDLLSAFFHVMGSDISLITIDWAIYRAIFYYFRTITQEIERNITIMFYINKYIQNGNEITLNSPLINDIATIFKNLDFSTMILINGEIMLNPNTIKEIELEISNVIKQYYPLS